MLFISKLDGRLSCSEHDPCGPEPLEPGEIREYIPEHVNAYPVKALPLYQSPGCQTDLSPQSSDALLISSSPPSSPSHAVTFNNEYSPISSCAEEENSVDQEEEEEEDVEEDGGKIIEEAESEPRYKRGLKITLAV